MNNTYKVANYDNSTAYQFKIGQFKTTYAFKHCPIQSFHFTLKNNTLITVCEASEVGLFGDLYKVWLIYSHDLNGTWMSYKSPEALKWLTPCVENYAQMWETLITN